MSSPATAANWNPAALPVAVVGGSLVGLTVALLLRDLGCPVDVYERSGAPLQGRGVGIVLHPDTVRYLRERTNVDLSQVSSRAAVHRYLDATGAVISEVARSHAFTGYDTLYRALLDSFDPARYHLGHRVHSVRAEGPEVELEFESGPPPVRAGLLVGADGISSTVRRWLLPEVRPSYAGYVAWRAVAEERLLSVGAAETLADSLTYFLGDHSHALTYPIPHYDGSVAVGRRLMNLVWYRNAAPGAQLERLLTDRYGHRRDVSVPPGLVEPHLVEELQAAARRELPPAFREVLELAGEPFLQVLYDVSVPRMAIGRSCLVGDAAFAVRPHAATATAKGAAEAWALVGALEAAAGDVPLALASWEPAQLRLGRALLERNRQMGDDVQFRSAWTPGDPALAFGLREPGDSATLAL